MLNIGQLLVDMQECGPDVDQAKRHQWSTLLHVDLVTDQYMLYYLPVN